MILKIGDLDHDLQGQIGLQTSKICILNIEPLQILPSNFCVIPCECNNF